MNKDLLQTIIAIALGSLAALAAVVLLGDFWRDAPAKSEATKLINEGTQIVGSNDAYYVDNFENVYASGTIDNLVPKYLKKNPDSNWAFNGTSGDLEYVDATKSRITADICQAFEAIVTGNDAATIPADSTGLTNRGQGCYGDETAGYTVFVR